MIRYLRPFIDKGKNFRLHRLTGFLRELSRESGYPVIAPLPKVLWCMYRGFNYQEIRFFGLHRLTYRKINTYHSTFDNVRLIERLNPASELIQLRDKGLFLKRFSHRLNRDFIDLRTASAKDFAQFVDRHPCFVAKAYNLAQGSGIEVIDSATVSGNSSDLHDRLVAATKFVVEEFITQHADINRVYADSVNSIRITTHLTTGGPDIGLPPTIRFGCNGGRIDFEGELNALIDVRTGFLTSSALDANSEWHAAHPDSGVRFTSVRIPYWEAAIEMVKAAAREIPEIRWIGWDVAITPAGPVLIEGNGAPTIGHVQLLVAAHDPEGAGCRRRLAVLT